jgi:hypothetical protein
VGGYALPNVIGRTGWLRRKAVAHSLGDANRFI